MKISPSYCDCEKSGYLASTKNTKKSTLIMWKLRLIWEGSGNKWQERERENFQRNGTFRLCEHIDLVYSWDSLPFCRDLGNREIRGRRASHRVQAEYDPKRNLVKGSIYYSLDSTVGSRHGKRRLF